MTDKSQTMAGFPPAPEHQVTLANWRDPPLNRWAFRNVCQIVPSAMVWRGAQSSELPANGHDLSGVTFSFDGETLSIQDMLERSLTDGFVVVHDGRIVVGARAMLQALHHPPGASASSSTTAVP